MSSKKNNDTLMNILKGNNYWNKQTNDDIADEVKDTKDYIKSGTAYTDEAAQKIRAGYAADGGKAKISALASNAADNGGNPDSYAGAQGDKADTAYRSAGEEAVRSRAATSEGSLIASDQNLISAFSTAAGANSTDLATGMEYNNNLANIETASGSADEGKGQSGANNDTVMNILKGNIYWNKKTNDDIADEVKDTKQYIKDGTAYTDKAADIIRGSFSNGEASDDNTYGANQKNRASGAYGAAAESAVIARAAQTESYLTESDLNLINAFKTAADANSADLATGMEYNANLASTEATAAEEKAGGDGNGDKGDDADEGALKPIPGNNDVKLVDVDRSGNIENQIIANSVGDPNPNGYTDNELIYAIYAYANQAGIEPEDAVGDVVSSLGLKDSLKTPLTQIITQDKEKTNSGKVNVTAKEFYAAMRSGDTSKTLGYNSYGEYFYAMNNEEV